MDKNIPLPELPLDPPHAPRQSDARAVLLHGLVWASLGAGGLLAAMELGPHAALGLILWTACIPAVTLGLGLVLYYVLAKDRRR